ncbi:MAG: biotin--[acetyl-CoA-carboxylase] ligase [Planctomycetota bacterium]
MEQRRFHHGVTDSTNERALAALAAGTARHGDLHVAQAQTAGRGRLGREWHSPLGVGLYVSMVLLPERAPAPAALTIAGGLAVLDAVHGLGLAEASLEWPNDVVVRGAKLAGILVETRGFDPRRPSYVLGVGLNVAQLTFPADLQRGRQVTSLRLEHVEAPIPEVERAFVNRLTARLEQVCQDPARLERDYVEAAGLAEGAVEAFDSQRRVRGRLVALTIDAGLWLEVRGERQHFPLEHLRGLHRI